LDRAELAPCRQPQACKLGDLRAAAPERVVSVMLEPVAAGHDDI
jgi:hypothetical protein